MRIKAKSLKTAIVIVDTQVDNNSLSTNTYGPSKLSGNFPLLSSDLAHHNTFRYHLRPHDDTSLYSISVRD